MFPLSFLFISEDWQPANEMAGEAANAVPLSKIFFTTSLLFIG
jgi:hypothetical protein